MPYHRRGHDANWTGPRNQHVFAEHRKRQRGMHGISERIEDRGHIQVHAFVMPPDVCHRNSDIVRECTRTVDAHAQRVCAQVPPASQAVPATAAGDVSLTAHDIAGMEVVYIGACLHNSANELVPNRHGHRNGALGPFIPVVDVQIGPANPRAQNFDQDIIDTDLRLGNVFEPQSWLSFTFDKCFHELS